MNTSNGAMNGDGAADFQRLREIIAHLESERKKDRQEIAELTADRDQYYRTIMSWYGTRFSKDEMEQWAAEVVNETPQSLDEVFAELGISKPE